MRLGATGLLLGAIPLTVYGFTVTTPNTVPGTGALTITLADDGSSPKLADIGTVQATLLAGGVQEGTDTMIVAAGAVSALTGSTTTLTLIASKGPADSITNAFYVKVVGTPKTGSAGTFYSNRFTVTGMTGTWSSPAVKAAAVAQAASPNNVPAGSGGSGGNANGGAAAGGGGGAAAGGAIGEKGDPHPTGTWPAYSMQSAMTVKMAPMQGRPGTKITATNTAPLYPVTAWNIFTKAAPIAPQISTQTPSQTHSVASRENPAKTAANPPDDMAKWLARWKD